MKNINMKTIIKKCLLYMVVVICLTSISSQFQLVDAQTMVKKQYFPNADKAKDEEPETLGEAACLIDAKSGHVIYSVDEHEKNYPASTTKILTALLSLENLDKDEEITANQAASTSEGSQIFLKFGEKMKVDDLMYAMMLPSANDAAIALGSAMAPTMEEYSQMMNDRAREAGAQNSNFVNPNGLPDDDHYTTAYDLAMITKDAMKYDDFKRYVTTYEYKIPKTNLSGKRLIHNRNRLLYNINRKVESYGETKSIKYEGVTGVKTGFTNKAQFCLVGAAERDGTHLIAVTMKTKDMNGYHDVVSMLDYGFNNYKTLELKKENQSVDNVEINGGKTKDAEAAVNEGLYVTVPIDSDDDDIEVKERFIEHDAPVKSGTNAGKIEAYYEGEKIGETDVLITSDVEKGSVINHLFTGSGVIGIFGKIFLGIIILAVILLIIRITNKRRMKRRRQLRRNRRGMY